METFKINLLRHLIEMPLFNITDQGGGFRLAPRRIDGKDTSFHGWQRKMRSKDQVAFLKRRAEAKRERRRIRNLHWVACGGEHPSVHRKAA